MQYFVYMLRCEGGSIYTGVTTDLERRFAEHSGRRRGGARYTALRRPIKFEAAWSAPGRSEALRMERGLKLLSRAEKENLVLGGTPEWAALTGCVRLELTEMKKKIMIGDFGK